MGIVEVIEVEGALGVALPDEVLKRLKLSLGDVVLLTETRTGFRLTPAGASEGHPVPDAAPQR